ncbi:sensor histidine kinase [Roseibium salinum]|uniref:histidine kinase n=1 Tax=Roseibium salinum TaxID=1604349 RepID=A0ABT3QX64_9HYPH|nr:PAS-domain containing protein [Roseibium sp. DSM 29163]MCX2721460.1 PAS-domain containing protein [Roseibium sp. DSM 29163]
MQFIRGSCNPLDLLNCLASSVHKGICVVDGELDLVMINRTALDLLDVPGDVIEADRSLAAIIRFKAARGDYGAGDPDKLVREQLETARAFVPHDFVQTRADGTVLRVQGSPTDNGRFVTIYTDITAEQRQERALLEARERLQNSLEERTGELKANRDMLLNAMSAISDGLAIAAPDGRVLLTNEKMRQIYPETAELIEKGARVSDVIRSVFPDEPVRDLSEYCQDGMWNERQFPDGRWYKVTRSRTEDGGMMSVYTDVTSYKEQHSVLQRHTDELVRHLRKEKELNEMQREFVSMASHEFRTPLAIIDSTAQRLKRKVAELKPDAIVERVDTIREAVERMQYLINRFLNFSQTQSVGMDIELEEASVRELVILVCGRQQGVSRHHRFHVDVERLPEKAEIDRRLVEQSVTNIISNAVKYSPETSNIHITGESDDGYLVISVRDEGVGIPDDEIPKIFKRYYRASTSSGIAGTGIGLNLTETIAKKHGGAVEIESEVGTGTTVRLRLPIRQEQRGKRRSMPRQDALKAG